MSGSGEWIEQKTTRAEFLSLFTIKLNTVSFNADLTQAVPQASACTHQMYTVKTMKAKHSKWKFNWFQLIGMLTKPEWLWQCLRRKQSDSHLKHKLCFNSLNRSTRTDAALDHLYVESIVQCHWRCLNWTRHCFLLFLLSVCMLCHVPPQSVLLCAALSASVTLCAPGYV